MTYTNLIRILKAIAVALVVTIPLHYLIESAGFITDMNLLTTVIIYLLISLILFIIITLGFKLYEIKYGMTITAFDF